MHSILFSIAFALHIALCVAQTSPNPCAFNLEGPVPRCGRSECAAVGISDRFPKCVRLGNIPNCFCPLVEKPVCCSVLLRPVTPIIRKIIVTKSNECECGCSDGFSGVLFEGTCTNPPTKAVPCTREFNPTCCYLPKFDLTFTAANPCLCTKAREGKIVSKGECTAK